jgi:hypothetical protein
MTCLAVKPAEALPTVERRMLGTACQLTIAALGQCRVKDIAAPPVCLDHTIIVQTGLGLSPPEKFMLRPIALLELRLGADIIPYSLEIILWQPASMVPVCPFNQLLQ